MLAGTFRLLKWEAKLVWALLGLAFALVTAIVRGATWLVRRVSRAQPRRQGVTIPSAADPVARPAAPAASAQPGAGVNVNVTVNNHLPVPQALPPIPAAAEAMPMAPTTTSLSGPVAAPVSRPRSSPAEILSSPDHGIYLTTGSALMVTHPFADALLEQLDRMLLAAAHRHGRPWMLPPELDASTPPPAPAPSLALASLDDGFDACARRPLPASDGTLWVARAGRDYARAVSTYGFAAMPFRSAMSGSPPWT